MRPRIPLPPSLAGAAFRTSTGRAAGLGRGRLAGADLARPFHGVREAVASDPADPDGAVACVRRARSYRPLLRPEDRFSHTTAAHLWPLPLPRGLDGLHVTTTRPGCRPRTRGVVGHETTRAALWVRDGMPVSDPIGLFVELGGMLGEDDLVAVGDALVLDPEVLDLSDPRPWIALDALRDGVRAPTRPRSSSRPHPIAFVRRECTLPTPPSLRSRRMSGRARAQDSMRVRWKLRWERDAVGPRWPW